jgi:hypothetical protein
MPAIAATATFGRNFQIVAIVVDAVASAVIGNRPRLRVATEGMLLLLLKRMVLMLLQLLLASD